MSCGHALLAGMDITFRGIEGDFTLRNSPTPVLLLAGGIGEPACGALRNVWLGSHATLHSVSCGQAAALLAAMPPCDLFSGCCVLC